MLDKGGRELGNHDELGGLGFGFWILDFPSWEEPGWVLGARWRTLHSQGQGLAILTL
jgi:hypothetical protein